VTLLKREYFKLCIAVLVIGAAIYAALFGTWTMYILAGIILGFAFFWLRDHHRISYGLSEVAAGIFGLYQTSSVGRGDFSADFSSSDFRTFQWKVAFFATLGAVYIIVRGLDNISQGWKTRKSQATPS
jgi:hypothetical protein